MGPFAGFAGTENFGARSVDKYPRSEPELRIVRANGSVGRLGASTA